MIFLVTGVTGLVGSHTAIALLAGGHRVAALVRGRAGNAPEHRIREILRSWPGWRERSFPISSLTAVEGDVSRPNCGLEAAELDLLRGHIDGIIHCAASVTFGGQNPEKELAVNVEGVRHVAGLTSTLACRHLVHVSTAYVERGMRGEGFRSAYERSKVEGERVLEELAPRYGLEVSVVRPSIVTGDSVFGFSPTYNGIYPFLRCIAQFGARRHRVRPSQWLPQDVYREGRVNLVPADHVAAVIRTVAEEQAVGTVYQVVAPVPWRIRELVTVLADHYGVADDATGGPDVQQLLTESEKRAFTALMDMYAPYFTVDLPLENAATAALMERRGIPPVVNDPGWIRALLAWGTDRNWRGV